MFQLSLCIYIRSECGGRTKIGCYLPHELSHHLANHSPSLSVTTLPANALLSARCMLAWWSSLHMRCSPITLLLTAHLHRKMICIASRLSAHQSLSITLSGRPALTLPVPWDFFTPLIAHRALTTDKRLTTWETPNYKRQSQHKMFSSGESDTLQNDPASMWHTC